MWHYGHRAVDLFDRFGDMGNFGWIGGIIMFVGLILVGVIIYLLVRKNKGYIPYVQAPGQNGAQDILKERLAKGEIDIATYDELFKKLK